jgi:hypothetical protein
MLKYMKLTCSIYKSILHEIRQCFLAISITDSLISEVFRQSVTNLEGRFKQPSLNNILMITYIHDLSHSIKSTVDNYGLTIFNS